MYSNDARPSHCDPFPALPSEGKQGTRHQGHLYVVAAAQAVKECLVAWRLLLQSRPVRAPQLRLPSLQCSHKMLSY